MFNMFNYLQIKGFENEELVKHFEKIDEANENLNKFLEDNPTAILRKIEISYADDAKSTLRFDINIEVPRN